MTLLQNLTTQMSTLTEFYELEEQLRNRLEQVRLVFELNFTRQEHEELKAVLRKISNHFPGAETISSFFPAIYVTSLTFTGQYEHQAGEFWSRVPALIRDDTFGRGQAFADALDELGLETFDTLVQQENSQTWLTRILIHAGIPHDYLPGFAEFLIEEMERGRSDPESLLAEWSLSSSRFQYRRKPTQRFLLHGGEPALDYLARCIATVEEGLSTGRFPSSDEVGLADAAVEALVSAARQIRHRDRHGKRLPAPRLQLDPFSDLGPHLFLPETPSGNDGMWLLRAGDDQAQPFRGTSFRPTFVPLPPSHSYTVSYRENHSVVQEWEFKGPGVREEDPPVLVFDPETDRNVPYHNFVALHAAHLVVPRNAEVSLDGGEPNRIEELPELTGDWSGWKQLFVDLNGVRSIRIAANDQAVLPVISPRERPTIDSEPVAGVTDDAGNPVFSMPPRIELPSGVRGATWRVRLTRPREDEQILDLSTSDSALDLIDHIDPSAFGLYRLVIRGPLGSDLRADFTLAPGLIAEIPDRVWLPEDGYPAVDLVSDASVNGAPPGELISVTFPPSASTTEVKVSSGSRELRLLVHIPRLLWTVSHRTKPTAPESAERLRIGKEEFEDTLDDLLLLSTGKAGTKVRLQLRDSTNILQESNTDTTRGSEGRWKFDLAPFSDHIRQSSSPRLSLWIEVDGASVHAADILTKAVPTKANLYEMPDGTVCAKFKQTRRIDDLEARLWSVDRPWEGPVVAAIDPDADRVRFNQPVPPGEYLFQLDQPDEWIRPIRPKIGDDTTILCRFGTDLDYEGYLSSLDPAEPQAMLELALNGHELSPDGTEQKDLRDYAEAAATVCEQLAGPDSTESAQKAIRALNCILNLFWVTDSSLVSWMMTAVESGWLSPITVTRLSLCAVYRPESSGAKWDPLPSHLMEDLWMMAPVLAAYLDVPYAVSDAESRKRCQEFLGCSPPSIPDQGVSKVTQQDVLTVIQGADFPPEGLTTSSRADETRDPRGLMTIYGQFEAKREWLRQFDVSDLPDHREDQEELDSQLLRISSENPALFRILNSRRAPRVNTTTFMPWMDFGAIAAYFALRAAGILQEGKLGGELRAIRKLYEFSETARRSVEQVAILSIMLKHHPAAGNRYL